MFSSYSQQKRTDRDKTCAAISCHQRLEDKLLSEMTKLQIVFQYKQNIQQCLLLFAFCQKHQVLWWGYTQNICLTLNTHLSFEWKWFCSDQLWFDFSFLWCGTPGLKPRQSLFVDRVSFLRRLMECQYFSSLSDSHADLPTCHVQL